MKSPMDYVMLGVLLGVVALLIQAVVSMPAAAVVLLYLPALVLVLVGVAGMVRQAFDRRD